MWQMAKELQRGAVTNINDRNVNGAAEFWTLRRFDRRRRQVQRRVVTSAETR